MENTSLKKHLYAALFLAMSLRFLSLYYVWGPQGLDDYLDNIIPAWRHLEGLFPDIHNYRSPFYMWILSYWMKLGSVFGIEHAVSQIRWVYFLQALSSLLGIVGVYRLACQRGVVLVGVIGMYLVVAHGLMPFASTRSFMESFVMGPVTLGFALLADPGDKKSENLKIFFGFFLLGLCTLLRFQAGLFYVAWMALFFFERKWRFFWIGFAFGFVLIGLEAGFDLIYGRHAFQTLLDYMSFNSDQDKSGRMPWYNTWATWLGFLYFPFSFLLGRSWWSAIKIHWRIFVPILFYVLVHSINPHKEERYLYPILPLSFLIWAEAWSLSISSWTQKYLYQPSFAIINTLVLAVGCFANTQVGLIGPLGEVEFQSSKVLYLDYDDVPMRNYMSEFFVRQPSVHQLLDGSPSAEKAQLEFTKHMELDHLVLMSMREENSKAFEGARQDLSKNLHCGEMLTATSISDQVLFRLNPQINSRRRPTEYFICTR